MPRRRPSRLAPMVIAIFLPVAAACAPKAPTAPFTTAQVERGHVVYDRSCANCHGAGLEGAVGPVLAGSAFLAKWSAPGRTAGELHHLISTTMPRPVVGSLSDAEYVDVLAYLLSRNGITPSGSTDATAAALATLRLPPPAGAATGPVPVLIHGDSGITPSGTGPTQADLLAAGHSTDWLTHLHDYAGTRHAPVAQVTPANARQLHPMCSWEAGTRESFVTGPLVWQGTMYITTATITAALDATTCAERWHQVWTPRDRMLWHANRGVALKDGALYRGTSDGYLVALDAANGHLLWARQVARPADGETITMAPLVFDTLVIIGPAGSENNVQGWIGAFSTTDGAPVWRFNTIPRPGEPGAETWQNAPEVPVGGGAVWTSPSLDPVTGELFVAVTNPAPDLAAHLRPGENLYTNSVVVLDVRTGRKRWHRQMVTSDAHDWDLTQAAPLLRVGPAGQERSVVITAGKDGYVRAVDRERPEPLYAAPVTTHENTDAPLVPGAWVHFCPGLLGGVEWNGPAWDPATRLLVTPAVDWCASAKVADTVRHVPGQLYMGGEDRSDSTSQGWLTAIDAATGARRWRYRSEKPMVAGVTTTAGGVVLTGETTGDFLVLDARSGEVLYRYPTGGGIGGGVISYLVGGRQYIATTSGRPGSWFGDTGSPKVVIFALPSETR